MKPSPYNVAEKSPQNMEQDLMDQVAIVYEKGALWAESQTMYEQLEDLKHTVLAKNMSGEGSIASQEMTARTSVDYINHLKGLAEARCRALAAKVAYGCAQAKYDALRTLLSNKREATKRGIE